MVDPQKRCFSEHMNVYFLGKTTQHSSLTRVRVSITVDAPVTAISNKTNDIQCSKDT